MNRTYQLLNYQINFHVRIKQTYLYQPVMFSKALINERMGSSAL